MKFAFKCAGLSRQPCTNLGILINILDYCQLRGFLHTEPIDLSRIQYQIKLNVHLLLQRNVFVPHLR